jgi:hypothetical protein
MEKFLLGEVNLGDKLHIVDQQQIGAAVACLKLGCILGLYGRH